MIQYIFESLPTDHYIQIVRIVLIKIGYEKIRFELYVVKGFMKSVEHLQACWLSNVVLLNAIITQLKRKSTKKWSWIRWKKSAAQQNIYPVVKNGSGFFESHHIFFLRDVSILNRWLSDFEDSFQKFSRYNGKRFERAPPVGSRWNLRLTRRSSLFWEGNEWIWMFASRTMSWESY